MVEIPSSQTPPELAEPALAQAIRFFSPRQKKILIISAAVFFVALAVSGAVFYFWLTSFKKSQVDFAITGPTQVASGDNVNLSVSYWNNTRQILQNAVLTVRYPQDALVLSGKIIQNIDLGSIGVGGGGKQEITVAFVGSDKSIQKIEAILNYKPQNTSSSFENSAVKEVAISGSALEIDFKTPDTVLPNLKNIYTIHYKNSTDKVFKNVSIEASYPANFVLASSDKTPARGNNVWNLGDLNSNEEGNIILIGILRNDTNVKFELAIGVAENGKFYKFNSVFSQINLAALPLKLDILVNNETSVIASPGDHLQFKLRYENAAGIALSDVVLKVKLDGLMYDFATIKTDGFYSSVDNTIVWNAGNLPAFKNLASGESGKADFDISVKPSHVIRTFRDKNFLLQVSAMLNTPTVPPALAVKELSVSSDLAIKVNTRAELKTKGYYFDAVLKNSGPLPPKVNQTTTYTVHWQITNFSNDVDGVMVRSVLPEGAKWLNKKTGAGAAILEYNDRTNELTWNVGKVQAGTGVLLDPYEVIFQISLTPPVTKAGQVVVLLETSNLTGKDVFTGSDVEAGAPQLKTDLPDDSGVGISKSRVQP